MQNIISQRVTGLILQSQRALPGVVANAGPLNLVLVQPDSFGLSVTELVDGRDLYAAARGLLRQKRTNKKTKVKATRRFGGLAREVLKGPLGSEHNEEWIGAGYEADLSIPTKIDGLVRMMQGVKGYLTLHPAHESGEVTAVKANIVLTELLAAVTAVDQAASDAREALTTRNSFAGVVRKNMQTLLAELSVKADPTGAVWEDFGLKRPGIRSLPDVPTGVTVTLVGPTAISVKWAKAARASNYRVWKKIVGVDEDFVLVDSRTDLDLTIEGLPTGKTIEIVVSASNNGGESARSVMVSVITA
jgi:hypothetical protein